MSGPTLFNEDGEPLFTPERPGIVQLGDLLVYINEMRNMYHDTQLLYKVLEQNLSFIGSGSPKGVYTNLAALQAAKPTGDTFIYVTTDNGNWYYWNGTSWTSGGVYQATLMQPNAITTRYLAPNSLDYFKHSDTVPLMFKTKPKNLFNKNKGTTGSYIKNSDGTLAANSLYFASDYMYVKPNTSYTMTRRDQGAWYDADRKFISGVTAGADQPYTVTSPANAMYFRLSVTIANAPTLQVEEGTVATPYEPFYTELLLDPVPYFKAGSVVESLISDSFKDKFNRMLRVDEILAKRMSDPTQNIQIKLLGDSITHGVGGTGYTENGDTIPGTSVQMNPNGYCWSNMLTNLMNTKYGGVKTFPFNDKYVSLKTSSFITNAANYQFFNNTVNMDLVSFSFKGDEFKVIYTTYANGGKVDVYFDGSYFATIDSYSAALTQNIETSFTVPNGKHTVTLKSTNTKNASSGGVIFTFQGFKTTRKVKVLNYAQSGKNSSHFYTQRDTVIETNDDIVFMQLGTNDRHNLPNTDETKRYQRAIIETAYAKGAKVILMSACPTTVAGDNDPIRKFGMYDVDKAIRELAYEYNMDYISNYDAFLEFAEYRNINMDTLLADGLHPNDAGYDVMFRNIVRSLKLHYIRPGITK